MNNALVLILATLLCSVIDVRPASVYTGTSRPSFSGSYTRYNPLLQGGGVVPGSINYQPDRGAFQLQNTLSGQTFTDTYQFIPPFPTNGFYTRCSASLTSTFGPSVAWSTPINIPAPDYILGAAPAVTAGAPSACEATPGSANCAVGTRISVVSASGTTINYKIDRFDDTYPSSNCGCAVTTFCLPVPSCVACSSVVVTGATGSCTNTAAVCGAVPNAIAITVSTASSPSFSVNMPGTTFGYGPVGLLGAGGKSTPVNCPSAIHTCAPTGSGVSRYRQTTCGSGQTCEVTDTQDMLYWPLWYNTDYYNPSVADTTMRSPSGAACNLYTAKNAFSGNNLVTSLFLTSTNQVCGWYTENGDQYTMTSYTSPAALTNFLFNCTINQCMKPLDIVFVVELSQVTSFTDRNNILNFIMSFTNYNTIGSQLTNIAVVTYSAAKGVQTALAQGVNMQQLGALDATTGLSCCNAATGDLSLPCCTGTSTNLLPNAIRTAADILTNFPFRTYTSKNIVLLTHGQFTNTAAEINTALSYASTVTVNRSSTQDPPASAIINFDSLYFGSNKAILDTLNSVKASNDARNQLLYSTKQLSVAGLESGFDTVVNRVWNRPNTNYIDYNMKEIVGGLCASNGGRSCGACCGECGCGTVCAPPATCKPSTCFNVSLVPPPPSTSTCCNYKLYQCPGATTNPCNVIQCDLIQGICTNQTKSCPPSTACYDYRCNPSTGACDPIAKFSDPNACFQAYCTTSNTVALKPKVTCQSIPCYTVRCDNATGACLNTSNTAPTAPSVCHVKTCVSNTWVWNWPSTCTSANKCLTQFCDTNTQTCYMGNKACNADSCNNVTCDPNIGTCNRIGCPANPTVNGVVDKCQSAPSCTVVANATLYSTCKYTTKNCPVTDPACQTSYCDKSTGNCVPTNLCPSIEGTNKCRLLLPGGCSNISGQINCTYYNKNCSRAGLCVNNTCNPATGNCDFPNLCSTNENGNFCRVLNSSSCPNGATLCLYNDVKCTSTDPCKNTTCFRNQSNTCPLPDLCPLYRNGDRCWTRVSSSCANVLTGGSCTYVFNNCTPSDPCMTSVCQNNTGTCTTPTAVCPLFRNGLCLIRDNNTCGLAPNCVYTNTINCTAPNAYSVSTCTTVNNAATCAVTSCPLYQTLSNRCRVIQTRLSNGTCVYENVTCNGTAPDACSYLRCDPATGTCGPVNYCPNSTNKCNFTVTCNGACVYQTVSCQNSADPCFSNTCDAASGTCSPKNICPVFETINGNVNRCRNRTTCTPCSYQTFNCTQPTDPCLVATCASSTGQCNTATKAGCDPFRNGDRCWPRNNASCTSATCTYNSVLATCAPSTKPCYYPTCSGGVCSLTLNTSFTARSCPPSPDPCLVPVLDTNQASCCSYVSNCTAKNLCETASCSGGVCTITPLCKQINPVNACETFQTCGANGTCIYGPKGCGTPPVACQAARCDAVTGVCSFVDTDACIDPCIGITCAPVNCTRQACFNGTCKPISNPPLCPTLADNYCAVGSCSPINNFCTYTAIQPSDCEARYGPANPCFYWGTSPTFPGCCQQLPLCNQQIDPNFKCMLLNCNNDTNGACVLVDNSNAVCPPYQNNDRCKPLIRCDNATGGCIYDDINLFCNSQQQQIDPCFDGVCNSTTGRCQTVNTTRCVPLSPCLGVVCESNKCEKYVCNETDGSCVLNATTVCAPLDNCTNRVCSPTEGCVPVAFNLSTCNNTDPCLTVFANTTKAGCCDTRPTCAPSADPICNQVTCVNGTCSTKVGKDLCAPFQFDNATNTSNKCQQYTDCKFGCLYSSVNCPASNVSCLVPYCDPTSGTCNFTDTCRNDKCVQQVCNQLTGQCDTISTASCKNDFCTNETCIPALGCVRQTSVALASCPTTNCTTAVLNPLVPGCCDTAPKCVASSVCTTATCLSNGTCVYQPACPAKKCQDVSCTPVDGVPQCFYSNKTCSTSSICEYVPPCVEDGKPFVCQAQSVCPQSTDRCVSILCNASATNEAEKCYNVSTIDCNDNNDCTVDTCIDGSCTHKECPFTDLCFPAKCNSSNFSCYVTPVVCNDNNACTNDTCFNGTCVYTNITCDDGDACTIDSCDNNLGCVFSTKECQLNESCAYDDPSDRNVHANFLNGVKKNPCAPGKSKKDIATCDSFICANQTCIYTKNTCNNYISTAEIIGGSLGAAAIIGIVIACVICAGASGAGVTAYVQASDKELSGSVMNNPLFRGTGSSVNNPLHRS